MKIIFDGSTRLYSIALHNVKRQGRGGGGRKQQVTNTSDQYFFFLYTYYARTLYFFVDYLLRKLVMSIDEEIIN